MVMMMMMPLVVGTAAAKYFFSSALRRGFVERKIPLSHYTNSIQSTARAIHRRPHGTGDRSWSVEARGNDVKLKQSG